VGKKQHNSKFTGISKKLPDLANWSTGSRTITSHGLKSHVKKVKAYEKIANNNNENKSFAIFGFCGI
jgi:hypothetical protein